MRIKHTPGPWKHNKLGVINGGKFFCTSVAETYLVKFKHPAKREPNPELVEQAEANTLLIAKAPELLAALRDLTSELQSRLHKLNIRRDFSLINYHACATKLIHLLDTGADQ